MKEDEGLRLKALEHENARRQRRGPLEQRTYTEFLTVPNNLGAMAITLGTHLCQDVRLPA